MAVLCARCGAKRGMLDLMATDAFANVYYCLTCTGLIYEEKAKAQRAADDTKYQRNDQILLLSKKVIVTTTPGIDGCRIKKYLGIESVEFVIGTGLFSELTTEVQDFFGARSSAFERKLQAAKDHAIGALKYRAAEKGANAVVAVDLDYTEFSGNRVALIINGTLVVATRGDLSEGKG